MIFDFAVQNFIVFYRPVNAVFSKLFKTFQNNRRLASDCNPLIINEGLFKTLLSRNSSVHPEHVEG